MPAAAPVTGPAPLPRPTLEQVYRDQLAYAWHAARRLGVAHADLEDVVQEVFMVVGRKLHEFDVTRPLKPWLFGITYRVASDWRRRAFRVRESATDTDALQPADHGPSPDEHASASQDRALVARALDTLDFDRRAVLVMHEFHDLAVPDIAAVTGVPVNTAYSRLRLARRDFADAVKALSRPGGAA